MRGEYKAAREDDLLPWTHLQTDGEQVRGRMEPCATGTLTSQGDHLLMPGASIRSVLQTLRIV